MSEKNRQDGVRCCQEILNKLNDNKWQLCYVILLLGMKRYRKIGRKKSNSSWVVEGENPRIVIRQGRFELKTMFTIFFKRNHAYIIFRKRNDHRS